MRWALLLTLGLALFACGPSKPPPPAFGMCKDLPAAACFHGRTVIIVRHAEKVVTNEDDKDPPLTESGEARARTLAAMLGSAGVTKLLATPFKRTHATLEPLAAKTGVPIETLPAEKMRDAIKAAPDGAVVVIASHSNVIPKLVRDLSDVTLRGVQGDSLDDNDYGRVIVLGQACGAKNASVTELSSNPAN
jgi:broad specificity phosphatase PhoE